MRLSRTQLWTLGVAMVAIGIALVPLLATAPFEDRGVWITLHVVIAGGFLGVGMFAWYRRPDNRVGALMVLTAFAWYLGIAARTEPALLFTIGNLLHSLWIAVAIHLLLAFPGGRLTAVCDRIMVGTTYVLVTAGYLPGVLFGDPFAYGCVECPDNLFLIAEHNSFVVSWFDGLSVAGIAILLAVLARLILRKRSASEPARRAIGPVFVAGGALVGLLALALAIDLGGASDEVTRVAFYSALFPAGLVPFLFLAGLVRARWTRGRGLGALVRRLAAGLEAGELRIALAEALGDWTLELAYWIPASERYVDAEGRPIELPGSGSGRVATEIDRDGRRIAAIVHDRSLLDDLWHVRAVGAAAALALENERLEAELRARVEELESSRSRMVEVGMRERRRLERNLHDGAQQRLVSLALGLRLARERLEGEPEDAGRLLDWSRGELEQALGELRELARGIHPAVLTDRGLGAAIETLAARAPVPVEIGSLPEERLPEQIELATYFVVAEALTNVAKYADASHATVAVTRANGRVVVEVGDDGIGGADPELGSGLRGLADRLATIEGALDVDSAPDEGTIVRARIPCE